MEIECDRHKIRQIEVVVTHNHHGHRTEDTWKAIEGRLPEAHRARRREDRKQMLLSSLRTTGALICAIALLVWATIAFADLGGTTMRGRTTPTPGSLVSVITAPAPQPTASASSVPAISPTILVGNTPAPTVVGSASSTPLSSPTPSIGSASAPPLKQVNIDLATLGDFEQSSYSARFQPSTNEYVLAISTRNLGFPRYIPRLSSMSDFNLEVDVRQVAGSSFGVRYGFAIQTRTAGVLIIGITPDGRSTLFFVRPSGDWEYVQAMTPTPSIRVSSRINHLAITRVGDELTLVINGEPVGTYPIKLGTVDQVGLDTAVLDGTSVEVAFSNLAFRSVATP